MIISNKKRREFRFSDVFSFERGSRLIKEEQIPGDIAYISSSKKNNGIDNYVSPPERMKVYRDKMTFSNSGSVGYLFYHDYDFVASDHLTVVWIKDEDVKLNRAKYLFLKPIIEEMKYKYNFAREISNSRLKNERIILPINSENALDWDFMEQYIIDLSFKIKFDNELFKSKVLLNKKLSTDNWKDFKISNLFNIERGRITNLKDLEKGNTPVVSAKGNNQGVEYYANVEGIYKNCLTASMNGTYTGYIAYHDYPFNANADCGVLIPKNFTLNKLTGLFLATILNQSAYKYGYSRKLTSVRIKKEYIRLPSKDGINPDWLFIEGFMRQLQYSSFLEI